MPSDFTIITGNEVRLPQGNDIDIDLFPWGATGIRDTQRPVLFYRVNPPDDRVVTLAIDINGTRVHTASYRTEARTFHEVVQEGLVRPANNRLTLRLLSGPGSPVIVSDVVLLYRE